MAAETPRALTPLQQEHRRKRILAELTRDLGFTPNAYQQALLEAAAALILENRLADIARARGEPGDVPQYCTRVSKLLAIYAKLGMKAEKPAEPERLPFHEQMRLLEQEQQPDSEIEPDDEEATPPDEQIAQEPIVAPVEKPAPQHVLVHRSKPKPAGVDIRELAAQAAIEGKTFAQVLEERQSKMNAGLSK
jgi:outer membrane biosynthesis protein TonB